jgi:hypothetical protein
MLAEAALSSLPAVATALKRPALRMERREVEVEVAVEAGAEANWAEANAEAAERFASQTGYSLVLKRQGETRPTEVAAARDDAWEINQAYAKIRKGFEAQRHAPLKVGLKPHEGFIEASFISPQVGALYRDLLDRLTGQTGWPIKIRESANQAEIAREARRVTPANCRPRGEPKFHLSEGRVTVQVVEAPPEDVQKGVRDAFAEATGFEIDWEES